jgi:hypothetical protein
MSISMTAAVNSFWGEPSFDLSSAILGSEDAVHIVVLASPDRPLGHAPRKRWIWMSVSWAPRIGAEASIRPNVKAYQVSPAACRGEVYLKKPIDRTGIFAYSSSMRFRRLFWREVA